MKKFRDKFLDKLTNILSIIGGVSAVISILAMIASIVVACLGYDFDSLLFTCIFYVAVTSVSLWGIILLGFFFHYKWCMSPEHRIIEALQKLAEEEEPFEELSDEESVKEVGNNEEVL